MAKPRSKPQLSLFSAPVCDDAAGIDADHWCRWFYRVIRCAFDDAEFADLYEEGGRYPVSPGLLACIMILQSCFRVSDRQAVHATVYWRDWRIALGLPVDYAGFCPTVLTRFRQRLVRAEAQERIFGRVLAQCAEQGLLRGRRVRVDATQLVSDLTRLHRADCIQEALRVVAQAAEQGCPELWNDAEFMALYERYGVECWVGGGASGSARLTELGRDGYRLLAILGERELRGKATLAQVLAENFIVEGDEELRPREGDELPADRIMTPHDADARYGKKGERIWLGQQVHVTEMVNEAGPNLVTDVHLTDPRREDSTVLPELLERVEAATPDVDTLIADGGYASAENTARAAERGVNLVTPPRGGNGRGRLPAEQFDLDFERQVARCPAGHESSTWRVRKTSLFIRFRAGLCNACPRQAECTSSPQGRVLHLSLHYEQLQRDRARSQTETFKNLYRQRSGIEATISKLVHRHGLRRSRYRGAAYEELHAWLAAAALNVNRLIAWLSQPPDPAPAAASMAPTSALTAAPAAGVAWARRIIRQALATGTRMAQPLWPTQTQRGRLNAAAA